MSLETRVETLEHEFKILKNEIERTLLEIQNQVLVHYYPSLRAEDIAPPKDLLPLPASAFAEAEDESGEAMAKRPTEEDETPAIIPKTKEISLTEIKQRKGPMLPAQDVAAAKVAAAPMKVLASPAKVTVTAVKATGASVKTKALPWSEEVIDQALLPALAKWVNESVEKIGKELTQNMVESSANTEQSSPEVLDLLLQFVTLCDEEHPPEEVNTKDLMDVLLKLDRMLGQAAKIIASKTEQYDEDRDKQHDEDHNGQGNHNNLHDHR